MMRVFSPGLHPQGMPRYLDLCCHSFAKPVADSLSGYHIFRRSANELSVPSYPRPGLTEMAKDFSKGCGREDQIHNGAKAGTIWHGCVQAPAR